MKNLFLYISILTLSISFSACEKENSTINGHITYVGSITGTIYKANNAEVRLYQIGNTGNNYFKRTTTNAEGYYAFTNIFEGDWYISSDITVTLTNYTGVGHTSTTGRDTKVVDIEMR